MANQAQLLEFFEMMLSRAERGEFRFVAIGTIDLEGNQRTTVAGMATTNEASSVVEDLQDRIKSMDLNP